MLVLTRKQGEQIRIGKDVTITVVRTKGKAVRIGIEAPAEMNVLRGELVDRPEPKSTETATGKASQPSARRAGDRREPGQKWAPAATQPEQRPFRERASADSGAAQASAGGPLRALMAGQAVS